MCYKKAIREFTKRDDSLARDLSPPPRLTRERKSADERRSQIIEAATQLIAERGFWGVTLRDAAVLCGITEAGVLRPPYGPAVRAALDEAATEARP